MSKSVFRRNVSWQLVGTASGSVLSGLVFLVLGRQLGSTGFGEFSIILSFITVANLLMEPRLQDVAARVFWNLEPESAALTAHRESFVDLIAFESLAKLLPLLAVVLLSLPLAQLANLPSGAAPLIAIAAAANYFAKVGYGVSTGVLRVLGYSDQLIYCGSGELLVRLAVFLMLGWFGLLTVATSVIVLSITLMLSNFAQMLLAIRHIGGLGGAFAQWHARAAPERLRPYRRLLLSNIGLSASDLMNKDLDITMLSPVMPAGTIGVYKMAKNIALLTWRAVDPFYLALMPEINRRIQMGDLAGTHLLIRRSTSGLAALAVAVSACVFTTIWFSGEALFGPAFAGIGDLLALMLIGVIGSAPLVWGHPLTVALNRGDLAFIGSLLGSAIGLTAFVILVSLFGIFGAAIAWSLTFLPGFLFTAIFARRLLNVRISAVMSSDSAVT